MAKIDTSYVISKGKFAFTKEQIWQTDWAAGKSDNVELSRLPADSYLVGLYFMFHGNYEQDGNGSDAIDRMELLNVVDRVEIANGSNVHLNMRMSEIAQDYKQCSGRNPLMSPSIAASATGSKVDTDFGFIVPFLYAQPKYVAPMDFCYPTTLLQDGNLRVHFNSDAALNGDANSAVQNGVFRVVALYANFNRAMIPPEVSVGYSDYNALTINMLRGHYQHIWLTGFKKTDFWDFDDIRMDADGKSVVPTVGLTDLVPTIGFESNYADDDLQEYWDHEGGITFDRNEQPQPEDLTIDYHFAPIYNAAFQGKISEFLPVDNRLLIRLTGTVHGIKGCWRRYEEHTTSKLEKYSRIMGFGRNPAAANRVNRKKLAPKDRHLKNILPVVLKQASPMRG